MSKRTQDADQLSTDLRGIIAVQPQYTYNLFSNLIAIARFDLPNSIAVHVYKKAFS